MSNKSIGSVKVESGEARREREQSLLCFVSVVLALLDVQHVVMSMVYTGFSINDGFNRVACSASLFVLLDKYSKEMFCRLRGQNIPYGSGMVTAFGSLRELSEKGKLDLNHVRWFETLVLNAMGFRLFDSFNLYKFTVSGSVNALDVIERIKTYLKVWTDAYTRWVKSAEFTCGHKGFSLWIARDQCGEILNLGELVTFYEARIKRDIIRRIINSESMLTHEERFVRAQKVVAMYAITVDVNVALRTVYKYLAKGVWCDDPEVQRRVSAHVYFEVLSNMFKSSFVPVWWFSKQDLEDMSKSAVYIYADTFAYDSRWGAVRAESGKFDLDDIWHGIKRMGLTCPVEVLDMMGVMLVEKRGLLALSTWVKDMSIPFKMYKSAVLDVGEVEKVRSYSLWSLHFDFIGLQLQNLSSVKLLKSFWALKVGVT